MHKIFADFDQLSEMHSLNMSIDISNLNESQLYVRSVGENIDSSIIKELDIDEEPTKDNFGKLQTIHPLSFNVFLN